MSDKLDAIWGLLHEMKPMLNDVRESQKAVEGRVRDMELQGTAHDVKITRLQSDVDGLGRKVRHYAAGDSIALVRSEGGNWRALIEFLAVLPTYWHVLSLVVMLLVTACSLLWRHGP